MGLAADLLAEEHGVARERQDAYAARSHARAVAARDGGGFDAELVPVAGLTRDALRAMAERARALARPHAAARVADELEGLVAA